VLHRAIPLICRSLARVLFDVHVAGCENMPASGAIVAGLPHRNWVEPFLIVAFLPPRRRLAIVAEGRTVSRSWWRRLVVRLAGGVIAIAARAGMSSFERIARAVTDTVAAGAAVLIFPESGPPSRPPEFRRLSPGVAHLAARSGASVTPIVLGGTHELYLRRRIVVRVLAPLDPPAGTTRPAVAAFMANLETKAQAAAVEVHQAAESGGPRWKVGRWLIGNYPRA
jgi:1-acyl-sn-glycerol-3-phosphate acyltransferase